MKTATQRSAHLRILCATSIPPGFQGPSKPAPWPWLCSVPLPETTNMVHPHPSFPFLKRAYVCTVNPNTNFLALWWLCFFLKLFTVVPRKGPHTLVVWSALVASPFCLFPSIFLFSPNAAYFETSKLLCNLTRNNSGHFFTSFCSTFQP